MKTGNPDFSSYGFDWYKNDILTNYCRSIRQWKSPLIADAYAIYKGDAFQEFIVLEPKTGKLVTRGNQIDGVAIKIDAIRLLRES